MFWVVPLSTKQKNLDFYFNYDDPNGVPVAAILAQLRLVSIKRFHRNVYELPSTQLCKVLARLRGFLIENRNPAVKRDSSEPEGAVSD
jgi:hypothetical protein